MNVKSSSIKSTDVRIITTDEVESATRRHDRLLSLLNEDEASMFSNSKIAARVEVSEVLWTREKLIDMIFQNLASASIIIEHRGETLQIPKYSEEVIDLAPNVAIFKPTPELTINLSDLDPYILKKLHRWDKKSRKSVLLQTGKRLFKTFYPYYYNTIADLLRNE